MEHPLKINHFHLYYRYNHSADYCFAGHTHEALEINVVTRGVLNVTYGDRIITLRENMLMICESDVFHRNRVLSPDGAELFVYHFDTQDIPHQTDARVYQLDENNLALVRLIADEAEKSASVIEENTLFASKLNESSLKLLEVLLMRLTEEELSTVYGTHPDEVLYRSAIAFMTDNLSRSISISDVANHCHVSLTKIKNIFFKYAGSGVISHFSQMKIQAAKQMIKKGLSVGEISNRLGYSSQAYLSLCFKKAVGKSPRAYKNEFSQM